MDLWLIIVLIVVGLFLIFGVIPCFIMSYYLYRILLVRNSKEKWGRECSIPDDEEYRGMFDEGMAWDAEYSTNKKEVEIESEGFRLVGEYFDFGYEDAVIIIAGRMESLLYDYYFAEPYRRAGLNVLVVDNRSHGNSEGRTNSLGQKEYKDIIAWARMLHDSLHVRKVILHGICIGSSTALFALTDPDTPDYLAGMVAEGMYVTFHESFLNHMLVDHHPVFPFVMLVMMYIRLISGVDVVKDGPIYRIDRLKKPILFLHSREDVFSLPTKAEELYNKCGSDKQIVWFDRGAHSRIRPNNKQKYDDSIVQFCAAKGFGNSKLI